MTAAPHDDGQGDHELARATHAQLQLTLGRDHGDEQLARTNRITNAMTSTLGVLAAMVTLHDVGQLVRFLPR